MAISFWLLAGSNSVEFLKLSMKNYFILLLLFVACESKKELIEPIQTEVKTSFATSVKADADNINQLYLHSNYKGEGYVKLINFGHKEQHLGVFEDDPNSDRFNFGITESLSSTIAKSEKYEDYFLTVKNETEGKDLKIKVHYEALNIDTIIVLKERNIIPLRRFKNPKQSKITVEILHPRFKLSSHTFEYFYSGLIISDKTELQSSILFKKGSEGIILYEYLESNDVKKVRSYRFF